MSPYRFFLRTILLFSPLVLLAGYVELSLWRTGETRTLAWAAGAMQEGGGDALFMRKLFDQGLYRFKKLTLEKRKPEILALGTSRVMQFRQAMFDLGEGKVFFNAGGLVQHIRDLEEFSASIPPDTALKVIILGLEPWWFNREWAEQAEQEKHYLKKIEEDDALDGFAHASVVQKLVWKSLRGACESEGLGLLARTAWRLSDTSRGLRLGLLSLEKDMGFRPDGSFCYGPGEPSEEFHDRENPPIAQRIREGGPGYGPSAGLDSEQVIRVCKVLESLKTRGIQVFCFLPPFSEEAARALEHSAAAPAWGEYRLGLVERIRSLGVPILDVSETSRLGMDDRVMYDGLHGLETAYLTMLTRLAVLEGGEELGLDLQRVEKVLSAQGGNAWYPAYQQGY